MNNTHTFHVAGTHCNACKVLIEDVLGEQPDLQNPVVSLKEETITVTTSSDDTPPVLAERFTDLLTVHGYTVTVEPVTPDTKQKPTLEWVFAISSALGVIALIVILERANIASFANLSGESLLTPFIVGLIASVSTCLAVVGSLVLSVSATYAKDGAGWRPQALFHGGRLGGFLLLGAALGALGSTFQIGIYGSQFLSIIASVVMLLLGIHLLDVTKRFRSITLPGSISRGAKGIAARAGAFAPVLLGASTFFLPCGFTQAMQVKALASGSLTTGALTMFVFALGTLPVLSLLSFGSLDLARSKFRGSFFKAAGLLVILFALFNIYSALVIFGIIPPIVF